MALPTPRKTMKRRWSGALIFVCLLGLFCGVGGFFLIAKMFRDDSAKLQTDQGRVKQKGLPLTLEDLEERQPKIPDADNAAFLYRKAANLYSKLAPPETMVERRGRLGDLRRRLATLNPVFALVKQATQLSGCNFGAPKETARLLIGSKPDSEGTRLEEISFQMINAANQERRDGHFDAAIEDLRAATLLASRSSIYYSTHFGWWPAGLDQSAFGSLFRIAQVNWNRPDVLHEVEKFAKTIEPPDFYQKLESEFVLGLDTIHHIKSLEDIGLDRNTPKAFSKALDSLYQSPGVKEAFEERYLHVYLEFFKRLPADSHDWLAIHRVLKQFRKELDDDMSVDNAMARQMAPAVPSEPLTYAAVEASKRLLVTTIEILKHHRDHESFPKKLPGSGPNTIDPLSGKPLHYRQEADGFTVYSVGVNMKDDGGKFIFGQTNIKPRPDDIVFRFRFPHSRG